MEFGVSPGMNIKAFSEIVYSTYSKRGYMLALGSTPLEKYRDALRHVSNLNMLILYRFFFTGPNDNSSHFDIRDCSVRFCKAMLSTLEDCSRLNSQMRVENLGMKKENWIVRLKYNMVVSFFVDIYIPGVQIANK